MPLQTVSYPSPPFRQAGISLLYHPEKKVLKIIKTAGMTVMYDFLKNGGTTLG
jgi:hypothetical protein